jgi:hypothetical protein
MKCCRTDRELNAFHDDKLYSPLHLIIVESIPISITEPPSIHVMIFWLQQNIKGNSFWPVKFITPSSAPPLSFSSLSQVSFTVGAWEWVYATNLSRPQRETRERERERQERNKQTARGSSTPCTNKNDPVTSTSELLLRQNSVTAHVHQS